MGIVGQRIKGHQHPISALVGTLVPLILILILLPTDVLGKEADGGPGTWTGPSLWETQRELPTPGASLA